MNVADVALRSAGRRHAVRAYSSLDYLTPNEFTKSIKRLEQREELLLQ